MDALMKQEPLSDEELGSQIAKLSARLSSRSQRFAEELACGATIVEAARRANLSTHRAAPYKHAATPHVAGLVRLLREQARRRAGVTAEGQIIRFQGLAQKAEDAGELSTAVAAEREVGKLANLYAPEVAAATGPVEVHINIGLPAREVPPAYLKDDPAAAQRIVDVTPSEPSELQPGLRRLAPAAMRGSPGSLEPVVPEEAGVPLGAGANEPPDPLE